MDQLRKLLDKLTWKQKGSLALAVVAVAGGLWAFTRWQHENSFRPLFSNLSPEDGSQILNRLRERGVEYRLGENGSSVLVPAGRAHELRMELAGEGLPKNGRIGFELFDKNNLGITDFQEQVNYHRALEGELERSAMSLAEVEQARVHLTFAKDSVFLESRQPAKASVVLKLRTGKKLSPQNVQAIMHLAASAVEGLLPEAVSVIDTRGNLLNRPRRALAGDGTDPDDAQLEFRQKVERDLLAKVNATLDDLLGAGKFRASASADIDFSSGEQSEETFDPTRSVMAAQQRTEDVSGSTQTAGTPGAASNLPRPISKPGDAGGKNVSRRTENITYQSTRTVRRLRLPQGAVKRISLSVLVDHALRWEGTGAKAKRILDPPPPEKLKKISDLVSVAVGLQTQRGDQLIVESLPFEATLTAQPPEGITDSSGSGQGGGINWPSWLPAPLRNIAVLAGIGGGLLLALLVGVFLLMRKLKGKTVKADGPGAIPPPATGQLPAARAQTGKTLEAQFAEQTERKRQMELEALQALRLPEMTTKKAEVLAKHITEEAKKDPEAIAHILRGWLQDDSLAR